MLTNDTQKVPRTVPQRLVCWIQKQGVLRDLNEAHLVGDSLVGISMSQEATSVPKTKCIERKAAVPSD